MVVSLNFKANTMAAQKRMSNLAVRQVPFAVAKSLTLSAKTLVEQNKRDTNVIFQNPTNWTRNAFFFIPAKKDNPRTIIKRKDLATSTATNAVPSKQNYLEVQQQGGGRRPKAFESSLMTKVKGASKFRYATPTRDSRLNASGNMTRGSINKILGAVGTKGGKFFIPKPNHPLTIKGGDGVFERMAKNKVKKRLHFTNVIPSYRKQFNFFKRMNRYGLKAFPRIFQREFRNALLSSKRVS